MVFKVPYRDDLLDRFEWRIKVEDKLHKALTKIAFNLDYRLARDWLEGLVVIKLNGVPLEIDRRANTVKVKDYVFKYDFSVINKLSESLMKDEFVV